jgi:hypothetical protein
VIARQQYLLFMSTQRVPWARLDDPRVGTGTYTAFIRRMLVPMSVEAINF